ncbi:MAG: four helix bundle protein [Candidatus Buchananbacteria bacterium RIFCSPHIGHO2_01_FULL_39_8]|uniref:Four helix bundle protein n=1 Tax=Candidatus Buchananbacteria bacterium RIFCSPHIGHO2_01_FULL_39_8 TaxID=1797533 RepID=A0A1G1Y109_9BACT|nr:MAG: four helix bundle protein [Candidatus Buchananbacteria bacterium RIFCSPHIGHO2_01_FULL_39_8]
MAQVITFRSLKVWQKAHSLVLNVYQVTQGFPSAEKFGLVSQMRRAAVSVACNIVEGFRRKSLRDSLNFYNIADSSLEELKYQIILSFDLKFLDQNNFKKVYYLAEEVSRMLCRWNQYQKQKLK